jgi:hypothetical protein
VSSLIGVHDHGLNKDQITRITITLSIVGGVVIAGLAWFGWWFQQQTSDREKDDGSRLDEQSKRKQTATMTVQPQTIIARQGWARAQDLERDNRLVQERAMHDPMNLQFRHVQSPRSSIIPPMTIPPPYV